MVFSSDHAQRSSDEAQRDGRSGGLFRPGWIPSWTFLWSVAGGVLALLWLGFRSGTKPSRLAYPCQQAAVGTAAAAFGVPLVAAVISARGHLRSVIGSGVGRITACGLAVLCTVMAAVAASERDSNVVILPPPPNYIPDVYLVNDARGIEPGRYGGVDDLVTLMGGNGLKLHRSPTTGPTWGPAGLIDADDIVLIKINAQWPQRGGTNTDVLRGVIRCIVEHPGWFAGEVIVADNGQGLGNLDRPENNAEDHGQSPKDVVNDFVAEGWTVSTMLWDTIRSASVGEYSEGDFNNGYVVNPVEDPDTYINVSYPKFQSAHGTYVSYKYGVWSTSLGSFEPDRLVVINIPVFKTHGSYAVTASVKNHMGVVTNSLGTGSHYSIPHGGMGSVLAEVRMPDLSILDCTWILARPDSGPQATYASANRRDQLVAGTDPIALDIWATKYIMMPQIIENGYGYSTYHYTQDPDNPTGTFRNYLDKSMNVLLQAGIDTTNDYNTVQLHVWAEPIPGMSGWSMIVLALSLLTAGTLTITNRLPAHGVAASTMRASPRCAIK